MWIFPNYAQRKIFPKNHNFQQTISKINRVLKKIYFNVGATLYRDHAKNEHTHTHTLTQ